jgi:uncharacterized RDD family membrane protein YckC
MPYCPRCGAEVPKDAYYCHRCGYKLRSFRSTESRGLLGDPELQRYWVRRLIAYVVDIVIVSLSTLLLALFLSIPIALLALLGGGWGRWVFTYPVSTGVVQLLYFTIMEWGLGSTVGKEIMGLRVEGARTLWRALLRNLTKLHGGLLLLDVLVGLVSGDPRRKLTDALSETRVVNQRYVREARIKEGRRGRSDPLGEAGLGVFIIILALIFLLRPHLLASIASWIMKRSGGSAIPPREMVGSLIWLLLGMSVWFLLSAAIRSLYGLDEGKMFDDVFMGSLALSFTLLLTEHMAGLIPLHQLPPLILILLGAAIAAGSILRWIGGLGS